MAEYSYHIDWYSYTVGCKRADDDNEVGAYAVYADQVSAWLRHTALPSTQDFFEGIGWERANGRKPYKFGYRNDDLGVFVWFGGQSTILFELSGTGCANFNAAKQSHGQTALQDLMSVSHERCTRIDFAIDIETGTDPYDFVSHGYNNRISSKGHVLTKSGHTRYVGSKRSKSRYARVYRYYDAKHAHRHHLLRIEMVGKKRHASMYAKVAVNQGVAYATQAIANYFNFGSPEMPKIENHNENFSPPVREQTDAGRKAWLKFQVAPAIRDMLHRGVLSKEELQELFDVEFVQERMF